MSAGFSPASLRRLRSWATGLMTDECRIVSHGRPVTDPHTGKATNPETVRYEGRCKVQTSGGLAAENTEGGIVQALGAVTPVWSLYLHLPYGTTDPNLKGRKFRLLNMQSEKTHATACRWNVKEVGNSNEQ